jgi:DNA (cytosine-5)-methyltransferase 1
LSLTVGSVCSGIGAPECAWRDLGWRFIWQAETEPAPSSVLAFHFPAVVNLGDMTAIAARVRSGDIEAPDVLVGGTPCQSFSVAGLRAGMTDARGNLALAFVDLANAIDAVRRDAGKPPCWVLWENVPGVFSDRNNAFGSILGGLVGHSRAVPRGHDGGWPGAGVVDGPDRCAAWRVLDAQYFGVAQRRRRVFVLARGGAVRWSCADALLALVEGVRWHPAPSGKAREDVAHCLNAGAGQRGGADRFDPTSETLIPSVTSSLNGSTGKRGGVPDADNAGGPLIPYLANPLGAKKDGGWRGDLDNVTYVCELAPSLTRNPYGDHESREGLLIAQTITAGDHSRNPLDETLVPVAYAIQERAVCENPDAGPDGAGWREGLAYTLESLNGPVAYQSSQSGMRLSEQHATLDANNGSRRHNGVLQASVVRRLMPIECERLQGFPDGWTDTPAAGRNTSQADGPRYKQVGNSMAVPVLRYIGERIAEITLKESTP